ncbi:hypothetical protein Glove_256g75 [Diversispora epigaea]|uniref:Uncharacterized protein n=1 Tax=Diversispora epigaea TaxID=1348612 RepID=A0A397IBC3_9GLOM|nr:hypothetical protein Glove_256g75 [Diversispora epigaea]
MKVILEMAQLRESFEECQEDSNNNGNDALEGDDDGDVSGVTVDPRLTNSGIHEIRISILNLCRWDSCIKEEEGSDESTINLYKDHSRTQDHCCKWYVCYLRLQPFEELTGHLNEGHIGNEDSNNNGNDALEGDDDGDVSGVTVDPRLTNSGIHEIRISILSNE